MLTYPALVTQRASFVGQEAETEVVERRAVNDRLEVPAQRVLVDPHLSLELKLIAKLRDSGPPPVFELVEEIIDEGRAGLVDHAPASKTLLANDHVEDGGVVHAAPPCRA